MAYEPKTWQCGEVVTANDLNHIERGIAEAGGGALIVNATTQGTATILDKTWQEIHDAFPNVAVRKLIGTLNEQLDLVSQVLKGRGYKVVAGETTYTTDSENWYPIAEDGNNQ